MSFIEDSWIAHTKSKYPREFASPGRLKSPVENDEQLTKLIKAYGPAHGVYGSVYSFDDWVRSEKGILLYQNAVIDCIFIDLDCASHTIAHYEAKLLDLYFNHYNCQVRIYFSGNKGFAIYIDFPELKLNKTTIKLVIRKYLESIEQVLSLRTIDRICFDGISRISRLPNTINHKSGLYCIPLTREELWGSLSSIKTTAEKPSKSPVIVNECTMIPGVLLALENEILTSKPVVTSKETPICKITEPVNRTDRTYPHNSLCAGIMNIIDGASKGNRDNTLCALICALNLQTSKSQDEIYPIVKEWCKNCSPPIDMQDSKLVRKIDYLTTNNYRPCTFAMRTKNKMCETCPVSKR